MSEKIKEKEAKEEVITAIYKLNLHCPQCAHTIEKPVIRTSGVQKVDSDVDSGKVTVKGNFDVKKIQEIIEKKSKRKVELISPKPKEKEEKKEEKEEKVEKKEVVPKTTVIRVNMHCEKCENDLEWRLKKLKGVQSVKMNRDAGTCTVVGTVEEKKLIEYIRRKVGKKGEIVSQKKEEEKKEEEKKEEEKKEEVKESKEVKAEKKEEAKVEEVKAKDVVVPYFIHCTHAPDWFSDENPNAYCALM